MGDMNNGFEHDLVQVTICLEKQEIMDFDSCHGID